MNKKTYQQAARRHAHQITKAYRYEDWTLVFRRDGFCAKVPIDTAVKPYPIVCTGLLPNADKLEIGIIVRDY